MKPCHNSLSGNGSKVDLWKLIKRNLTKMGVGKPEGRGFEALPALVNCRLNRKRGQVHTILATTLLYQQEKGGFSSSPTTSQPMRDCRNSAMKATTLELPVSSTGFFSYNSPLPSIKEHSFFCSSDLPMVLL